jgi:alkylation response protein AidB-like acyl-CoA dehydrogenase
VGTCLFSHDAFNAEGDEQIKQDYLVPSISGDKIGALCISEPFGGSDVAGMRTLAVKKGDKYYKWFQNFYYKRGVCRLLCSCC